MTGRRPRANIVIGQQALRVKGTRSARGPQMSINDTIERLRFTITGVVLGAGYFVHRLAAARVVSSGNRE